jgi:hypothetical protein
MGKNNISVSYPGSTKYNGDEATTTFTVDKQDTLLTIDEISGIQYLDYVTINGTFKTKGGQAIINSNVVVYINGEHHTVKTNNKGVFSYGFKATCMGKNNITVKYAGNTRYVATETKTTFVVDKKDTKLTLNIVGNYSKGNNITVTGKFTTIDGVNLINSNIVVYINGEHHTVKTNSSAIYSYTFVANKIGKNNITVEYMGNPKYDSSRNNTLFTVNP